MHIHVPLETDSNCKSTFILVQHNHIDQFALESKIKVQQLNATQQLSYDEAYPVLRPKGANFLQIYVMPGNTLNAICKAG